MIASTALFAGCGDGPDPVPTPTRIPTAPPTTASTRSPENTTPTGGTPVAKIGLKASDLSGLTTTASGLQYVDEVVGTGATPTMANTVTVHYTGTNATTGEQFDSSVDRGAPASFPMTGVIKGFSEGILTMKVGGKRNVLIPAGLGYGAYQEGKAQTGDIIFKIELISFK